VAREVKFSIGRDRQCDVPIADDSVSRLHAELVFTESNQILLTDCRSSNGTFLIRNGKKEPVRQEVVSPADTIQLGSVVMPMADVLNALRQKHRKKMEASPPRPPDPAPPARAEVPLEGKQLVRCMCGAVIVKGEKCRMCGA
jgi:pSer/pThr/pTyr-binding forkhead associated (FHA) protein